MRFPLKLAGFLILPALAGCGEEKGPGGLSAEEERGLDNAASMLDSNDIIAVPDDSLVANEEAIAAEENQGATAADAGDNAQ